ncbi:LysR substrate-binding domain-containing protein [Pseudomonas sp. HLMP]|uniref:LysR substrate-binding domain-containing protein n=1 Tax=Pseudomonas sp. HLMP TaxID=3153767 RepID=UPI003966EAAE
MRQDQLDGLVTFVQVARQRSFTSASHQLGVSPSAVSQVVRGLEHRLGVVLFKRTTRSVRLTEAGGRFLKQIEPLVEELVKASQDIADSASVPSGELRLVATTSAYMTILRPALGSFLEQYPAIEVEVILHESRIDLVLEGFDAGFGLHTQVERDLVAVSVGSSLRMGAFASPAYLSRRPAPDHPDDLHRHECIGYRQSESGALERWAFDNGQETIQVRVKSRLIYSNPIALTQAAVDGFGIAYMADGHLDALLQEGKLARVLADWSLPASPYMLYFPDRRSISKRLRLLIDHLRRSDAIGN